MRYYDEKHKACDDLWQAGFDHPFIQKIAPRELNDHFRKSNHNKWQFTNTAWTIHIAELAVNES